MRKTRMSLPIMCPPSTPMSAAIFPCLCASRTSAAVDPDRKENGVHPAFAHARNVHVPVGIALTDVVVLGEEPLRGVVMRVKDDRGKMKLLCPLSNVIGRNT